MKPRTLVAGIGNIFFGDDGFGVEVIRRLSGVALPENVRVIDFGIRGVDLAYHLLNESYESVVLVDTVQRGQAPGTIYLITPQIDHSGAPENQSLIAQTHGMDPAKVLTWVNAMGGKFKSLRLVGCEPEVLGTDEDMRMELSEPVTRAVGEALNIILKLVEEPCTNSA